MFFELKNVVNANTLRNRCIIFKLFSLQLNERELVATDDINIGIVFFVYFVYFVYFNVQQQNNIITFCNKYTTADPIMSEALRMICEIPTTDIATSSQGTIPISI